MTSKDLRAKRANLWTQANAIIDRAETEKRSRTAEENAQIDALHAEMDTLLVDIERIERQEKLDLELRGSQGTGAGGRQDGPPQEPGAGGAGGDDPEKRAKQEAELRTAAFRNWMVYGMAGLMPEHRAIMATRLEALPPEARAMAAGIDTTGGYVVFDEFMNRVETAMLAFSGIRRTRATVLRTNSGNQINMPTSDDTSNTGALVGENTDVGTPSNITLGSKPLNAYMFTSKPLRVSLQFLQDSNLADTEGWIAERLAERIARGLAPYFITGTGNSQPEGLAQAGTLGKTGASATAVTYDDFVDLEHSVDMAYRMQAEWLLGDGILKAAKKLKDGEGRPLWVPGLATREPDAILGYRYAVDMQIPTPAASAKTMYFGDFSKFIIRDVRGMQMLRLTERYAEYLQVAFLLFSRHDSILLDAGTNPIKYFQQSA